MDGVSENPKGEELTQINSGIIKTLDYILHNPSSRNPEALGVARYRDSDQTTEITIGVAINRDGVVDELTHAPKMMLIQPPVYSIEEADTRIASNTAKADNRDYQYIIANGKLYVRHIYYFFSSGGLAKKVISIKEMPGGSPLTIFEEDEWKTQHRQQVPISSSPVEEGDQVADLTRTDYEKVNKMLTDISSGTTQLHTSATIQELNG